MLRVITYSFRRSFEQVPTVKRFMSDRRLKETFQYRVQNYFEQQFKQISNEQDIGTLLPELNLSEVRSLNPQENQNLRDENFLKRWNSCQRDIEELKDISDEQDLKERIDDLDYRCVSLLHLLKPNEIISILLRLCMLARSEFSNMYFYDKSLDFLMQYADTGRLQNHESIQLLYLLMSKKNKSKEIEYLKLFLPDMNELSLMDKCIVAWVMHRAEVPLQFKQTQGLEKVLEQNFDEIIEDPLLFVPLCKAIIMSTKTEELCLKGFGSALLERNQPLSFSTLSHALSLYAEALLMEPKVIDVLVKDGIEIMKNDMGSGNQNLNLIDVSAFLWATSHLGLVLTLNEKIIIRTFIERRWREYRSKDNFGILIDSMLSLNMLRCWSMKLLKMCLQERLFIPILAKNCHWKLKTKFQLLITQMTMEMKLKVPQILINPVKIGYKPSENLKIVHKVAFDFVRKGIIKNAVIECPVQAIVIPGVTLVTDNDIFHIDILDNVTCLRNTNIPHGLMNLKLRLLSRLRFRQVLINGHSFNNDLEAIELMIHKKIQDHVNYGKAADLYNIKKQSTL